MVLLAGVTVPLRAIGVRALPKPLWSAQCPGRCKRRRLSGCAGEAFLGMTSQDRRYLVCCGWAPGTCPFSRSSDASTLRSHEGEGVLSAEHVAVQIGLAPVCSHVQV